VAQTLVLLPRLGITALMWPVALSGAWALGWVVSEAVIGTSVDQHFCVFGASGAIVVATVTTALPLALNRSMPGITGRSHPVAVGSRS
jgi:hypothetical protein